MGSGMADEDMRGRRDDKDGRVCPIGREVRRVESREERKRKSAGGTNGTDWDGNETVLGRNWGFGVAFFG